MSSYTQAHDAVPIIRAAEGQHFDYNHPSPISNTTQHQQFNNLPLRSLTNTQFLTPAPSDTDSLRYSHSPISTIESSPATSTIDFDPTTEYYMQRPQQAPQQHISSQQAARHPSLETVGLPQSFWGHPRSAIVPQRTRHSVASSFHKRTSSDSTIQSAPYTPTSYPQQSFQQPYIVDPESHHYPAHTEAFDQYSQSVTSVPKSYPHISQPLEHPAYLNPEFQAACYNDVQTQLQWNETMRLVQQTQAQFQGPIYRTMGSEELTPTMQEKMHYPLEKVPGLPRTISAICEDELYNIAEPTVSRAVSSAPRIKAEVATSSPTNSVFSQRLQAANQSHLEARSASPTASSFNSRDKSPFRPDSKMSGAVYDTPQSPGPRMTPAAMMREQQRAEALANATRRTSRESSQTVSPKDVSLEYEAPENDNVPAMFGSLPSPTGRMQHNKRPSRLNQELTRSSTYENLFKREESSNVSNDSVTSAETQQIQVPQQYPFIRSQRPSAAAPPESSQESNPRFPPTLISMESTTSERSNSRISAGHSPSVDSQHDSESNHSEGSQAHRPNDTRSDGGTYTCTYHGCTKRFETPQKLQKHKKEGHRQGTPSTNADARLTQAGPHTCKRLNPQTGKPCNSVFSRPYDLTRHEDTIHNAKKIKVRCQYCTEEKTFSRNDALTRHMRVVHPEIAWDAKSKRASR